MTTSSVLSLHSITRAYQSAGGRLEVLKNANLTLAAGEMVALIGPSGAGKTTLLQIAGLLDKPENGEITIDGVEAARASDAVRTGLRNRAIGFVYQFHHLLPELSARENVMMPLLIAGKNPGVATTRANALLEKLGLKDRAEHLPSEMSGGEQQRVAIARALVHAPKLLLADEPTGNLDPATAAVVFKLFCDAARDQGSAVLLVTHNHELAGKMDRIITLKEGAIIPYVAAK